MAKLFTFGLLCFLLFSSIAAQFLPPKWENFDWKTATPADYEQMSQEVFRMSYEDVLATQKSLNKRAVVCTPENSDPANPERQLCNDGIQCTGLDLCTIDQATGDPVCKGSNKVDAFSNIGKACVPDSSAPCNQGKCTANGGDVDDTSCSNVVTIPCNAPATECHGTEYCNPNGGCKSDPTNANQACSNIEGPTQNGCYTDTATCKNGACLRSADSSKVGLQCTNPTLGTMSTTGCSSRTLGKCVSSGACQWGLKNGDQDNQVCTSDFTSANSGNECYVQSSGHCTTGVCYRDTKPTGTSCSGTAAGSDNGCRQKQCQTGTCTWVADAGKDTNECPVASFANGQCEKPATGTCSAGTCNAGGVYLGATQSCTLDVDPTKNSGDPNADQCLDRATGTCDSANGKCKYTKTITCAVAAATECKSSVQCSAGTCTGGTAFTGRICGTIPSTGCAYTSCSSTGSCDDPKNIDCGVTGGECKNPDHCDFTGTAGTVPTSVGVCKAGADITGPCTGAAAGTDNGCKHKQCQTGTCTWVADAGKDTNECPVASFANGQCEKPATGTCSAGTCNAGGVYLGATQSCTLDVDPTKNSGDPNADQCLDRATGTCDSTNGKCKYTKTITCAVAAATECKSSVQCSAGTCTGGTAYTGRICGTIPSSGCTYDRCSSAGNCDDSDIMDCGQTTTGGECKNPNYCDFTGTAGTVPTASVCQTGADITGPCTGAAAGTDNGCKHKQCQTGTCTWVADAGKDTNECPVASFANGQCEKPATGTCSAGTCNAGGVYLGATQSCTLDVDPTKNSGDPNADQCLDRATGTCDSTNGKCQYTKTITCAVAAATECKSSVQCSAGTCTGGTAYTGRICGTIPSSGCTYDRCSSAGNCDDSDTMDCGQTTTGGECKNPNYCDFTGTAGTVPTASVCQTGADITGSCTGKATGTDNGCKQKLCQTGTCTWVADIGKDTNECTVPSFANGQCEKPETGTCSSGTCNAGGVYLGATQSCTLDVDPTKNSGDPNADQCLDRATGTCDSTNGKCQYTKTITCAVAAATECKSSVQCSAGTCTGGTAYTGRICGTIPSSGCTYDRCSSAGNCDDSDTMDCGQTTTGGECKNPNYCDFTGTAGTVPTASVCKTGADITGPCTAQDTDPCHYNWHCSAGSCAHDSNTCPTTQANECLTVPACNGAGGCTTSPKAGSCSDGNPCTVDDTCNAGSCVPGTAFPCSGTTCTAEKCQSGAGGAAECVFDKWRDATTTCDDGDKCTLGDHCSGTSDTCVAGTSSPPPCTASGSCKVAGTCQPSTGTCSAETNAADGFDCKNGTPRPLDNRCIPDANGLDSAHCNNQACVPDDSPGQFKNAGEGFCSCWSGWKGKQCEGYPTNGGASDNPNAGGVGQDAFPPGETPSKVDEKKGDFTPTVKLTLGNQLVVTIDVPSSQNPWNKEAGSDSFSKTTVFKFEAPVQNTNNAPSRRSLSDSVEKSNALHAEFGTIGTVVPSERKRAATNANPNSCNYPNNFDWQTSTNKQPSGQFVDTYTNTITYSQLAACGLTYIKQDENYAYFNGSVKIERNFFLGNGRFHFDRTYSVEQDYAVLFPTNLKATTQVVVSNNTVEFWAAVTKINFDPVGQVWKITVGTAINRKYYKLELTKYPAMNAQTPGPFAAGSARDWSYVGTNTGTDCNTYGNGDCSQEFIFETHSCDPVVIYSMVLEFKAVCRQNGTPDVANECADPNADVAQATPSATVDINTGSTCPVTKDYVIQNAQLNTYSSATFATSKTLFGISETMYAAVDFTNPPADLQHIQVNRVCAYPRNFAGVVPNECPDSRKVATVTTDSPVNPGDAVTGGHKIAFSLLAGDLKAKAAVSDDDYNQLDMQVDLILTYTGTLDPNQKRYETVSRTFTISSPVSIQGAPEKEQVAGEYYEKSSASATTFGLIVLVLAIAALL